MEEQSRRLVQIRNDKRARIPWLISQLGTNVLHTRVGKMAKGEEKLPGLLDKAATSTLVAKPTVEALKWITVRWKEYENIRVDRIMKVGAVK